ncbi:hypothetical protein Pint_22707 [Pistacia integerrima]|uniref:Uncharacterized protein n=2 Tax=Pistacia TaxID=55512 RepID=A0ACC1BBE5_9ROSI|nr:hypothetical protein Pint_22707 [Pistacia integerrima]KAJ0096237.1 hypothetical protein Patl1_15865 [Pistacia atlantica]
MAETPSKRQREETQVEDIEETKRPKSYNHILSLLEDEEDELSPDLSSFITNLQQEISSDSTFDKTDQENNPTTASSTTLEDCTTASSTSSCSKEDEEDDRERVIRHLLQASDDELGIPNMEVGVSSVEYGEIGFNGGDGGFSLGDGLWELEDQTANYYALLQSQLFM